MSGPLPLLTLGLQGGQVRFLATGVAARLIRDVLPAGLGTTTPRHTQNGTRSPTICCVNPGHRRDCEEVLRHLHVLVSSLLSSGFLAYSLKYSELRPHTKPLRVEVQSAPNSTALNPWELGLGCSRPRLGFCMLQHSNLEKKTKSHTRTALSGGWMLGFVLPVVVITSFCFRMLIPSPNIQGGP